MLSISDIASLVLTVSQYQDSLNQPPWLIFILLLQQTHRLLAKIFRANSIEFIYVWIFEYFTFQIVLIVVGIPLTIAHGNFKIGILYIFTLIYRIIVGFTFDYFSDFPIGHTYFMFIGLHLSNIWLNWSTFSQSIIPHFLLISITSFPLQFYLYFSSEINKNLPGFTESGSVACLIFGYLSGYYWIYRGAKSRYSDVLKALGWLIAYLIFVDYCGFRFIYKFDDIGIPLEVAHGTSKIAFIYLTSLIYVFVTLQSLYWNFKCLGFIPSSFSLVCLHLANVMEKWRDFRLMPLRLLSLLTFIILPHCVEIYFIQNQFSNKKAFLKVQILNFIGIFGAGLFGFVIGNFWIYNEHKKPIKFKVVFRFLFWIIGYPFLMHCFKETFKF
ncbi:unnamed protein product [Caenorhabditis angaria]|uniref:Uncharacterized protein n=1 Tax=Caenorhabditis angaria TaxID=860376 RepID=A0A9P1ICJ0_9PELO|nr:unnamed protein product [Caenorhabditis angaria]